MEKYGPGFEEYVGEEGARKSGGEALEVSGYDEFEALRRPLVSYDSSSNDVLRLIEV